MRRDTLNRLLTWYHANRRALPWRKTKDHYVIWVSEVMLQQTQAATVDPYFERFLHRFPTVQSLAEASPEKVLLYWQGLGLLLSRGNLHAGTKVVVADCGSQAPSTMDELLRLPGVGRSTAGAIASIAFGQAEPVVDGNVARVLCRFCGARGAPRRNPTHKHLWALATQLARIVAHPQPHRLRRKCDTFGVGDLNQALMELGAVVCKPLRPDCRSCPVAVECAARQNSWQHILPETHPAKPRVQRDHVCVVIRKSHRYLIARRPLQGRWGGLWEFPRSQLWLGETLEHAATRLAKDSLNLTVEIEAKLGTVHHSFTYHRIALHVFACHRI